MPGFRERLSGGTRTSVGAAGEVVQELLDDGRRVAEIYDLFLDDDPVVALRASYAAMKLAEERPDSVVPFAGLLLKNLGNYTQQEVRWHVPQLLAHLRLTDAERKTAYEALMEWAETDKSKIVGYYSLQTAADYAQSDAELLADFLPRLRRAHAHGAKSIQNRCKKIAKQLKIEL